MFLFEYSPFVLLATVTSMSLGTANAIPQNMDSTITDATGPSTGCSANYDGQFGFGWIGAYETAPPRTMDCSKSGTQTAFRATLTDGTISLAKGDGTRATLVLRNDGTVEELYDGENSDDVARSDGFAICEDGYVKLDDREIFYGCLREAESITDVKVEDEGNCRPIRPRILPCKEMEGTQVIR